MSEQESRPAVVKYRDATGRTWAAGFVMERSLTFEGLKDRVEKVASKNIIGEISLWFDDGTGQIPLSSQAELDAISYDRLTAQPGCILVTLKGFA
jgi:hypothetical protein